MTIRCERQEGIGSNDYAITRVYEDHHGMICLDFSDGITLAFQPEEAARLQADLAAIQR